MFLVFTISLHYHYKFDYETSENKVTMFADMLSSTFLMFLKTINPLKPPFETVEHDQI